MTYNILTICPVCGEKLEVIGLCCSKCGTKYEGSFKLDKFSYLTLEQKKFIEIFLKCRGNIKDVEKELNISYPTVRGKLDDVIISLGYEPSTPAKPQANKREILDMLENGQITSEEAVRMIEE